MKGIVILALALMIGSLFATGFTLAEEIGSATTIVSESEISPMPDSARGVGSIPVMADEISPKFDLIDTIEIQASVGNVQSAGNSELRASGFPSVFSGVGYAISAGETKSVEIMIANQEYSVAGNVDKNSVVSNSAIPGVYGIPKTKVAGVKIQPVMAQAISPNGLKFGVAKSHGNSETSASDKGRLVPVEGINFVAQGKLVLGDESYTLDFDRSESDNQNVYSVIQAGESIGVLKLNLGENSGELSLNDKSYKIRLDDAKTQKVRPVAVSAEGQNHESVFAKTSEIQPKKSFVVTIFDKILPWNWFK